MQPTGYLVLWLGEPTLYFAGQPGAKPTLAITDREPATLFESREAARKAIEISRRAYAGTSSAGAPGDWKVRPIGLKLVKG